jgi:hypothetical protein
MEHSFDQIINEYSILKSLELNGMGIAKYKPVDSTYDSVGKIKISGFISHYDLDNCIK